MIDDLVLTVTLLAGGAVVGLGCCLVAVKLLLDWEDWRRGRHIR